MGCIMRRAIVAGCAVVSLLQVATAVTQNLSIDRVMTPAQLEATGVASLSPTQRAALDRWLTEYTLRVVQGAKGGDPIPGGTPAAYGGIGPGHWVMRVSSGGRVVLLEDGSLWEIQAADRAQTGIWRPTSDITVTAARTPTGDCKYVLFNKDHGDTVVAKFLGK
jgi:hypothetical protein